MTVVAIILVFIFAAYLFRNYWGLLLKAKWYGTETEATVSRIEEEVRHSGGEDYPVRFCYVVFQTRDGLQNEARLLNPKASLAVGNRLRIRYLPDRADRAILVKNRSRTENSMDGMTGTV